MARIKAERITALRIRCPGNADGHRLGIEAHDLRVQRSQAVLEGLGVHLAPDDLIEVGHVRRGHVWISVLAERSSKAWDRSCSTGHLREFVVGHRVGGIRGRLDSIELVKDTRRRLGTVVEEEEQWTADEVKQIGRQAKLEGRDDSSFGVWVVPDEVGDCREQRLAIRTTVGPDTPPDLPINASRVGL